MDSSSGINRGNVNKQIKIVITGPESTGKTTLTYELSRRLKAPAVPEYARQHLDSLPRPYRQKDLIYIAKAQVQLEEMTSRKPGPFLICDTDLLTIKIWLEDKFSKADDWLNEQLYQRRPDLYLLCDIDLPWQPDPQREDANRREHLLSVYEKELNELTVPWKKIKGTGEARTLLAMSHINKCFP